MFTCHLENNNKFIYELKSTKFSINLVFKSNNENNLSSLYSYSYSIIFDKGCPTKVEPFLKKNLITNLDKKVQEQIKNI